MSTTVFGRGGHFIQSVLHSGVCLAVMLISVPATAEELITPAQTATASTEAVVQTQQKHWPHLVTLDSKPVASLDVAKAELAKADAHIAAIVSIADEQRTFANTIGVLDDIYTQLDLALNMSLFMNYVSTNPQERALAQSIEELITNWYIDTAKREDLYHAVKAYAATQPSLEGEESRLLQHVLRDYRRAGMELSSEDRARLVEMEKQLAKMEIDFNANIRDDETRIPLTRAELSGLPLDYFEQYDNVHRVGDVFLVGVSYPEALPVFDYCDNETTRKKVWLMYKRKGGQKNVRLLEQIIVLRAEIARILGYDNYVEYTTEIRMAKDAETVQSFYEKLRPLVRKKALLDFEELTQAKREHTGNPDAELKPWDFSFYLERLKKEKYAVDSEIVRQYFPIEAVTEGLFSITQSLYGITYKEVTDQAESLGRRLWHEDVHLYEVYDDATSKKIGEFFIDLHPRPNKYSHAAQWGLAPRKVWSDGSVSLPVAALVCNFTKPTKEKPSLMSHDEVETFFHEFGHCLHTILSEARFGIFAGTRVERDFVEAPSQMFENWVWDADVLRTFSSHYETGEPLPEELLQGMLAAKHLASGLMAERQFYYGLFDLYCHLPADGKVDTTKLAVDLWEKNNVELFEPVSDVYFQAGFGHLTGYAAGYYGYQWSLVYACDMFQRFEEFGLLNPEAGQYYREHILSRGGTLDGLDLVRGYLGREPDMTAYLRHLGLENSETEAVYAE